MENRIRRKVKQLEDEQEKLLRKMEDRLDVYGADNYYTWWDLQIDGLEVLIGYYKELLQHHREVI